MGNLSTIIVPGDVYFVTTTVIDCTKIFIEDKYCQIIIDNLRFYREKYGFKLYSFVVMPNHVHLLILPKFDEVGSKEPIFTDRSSQQPGHVGSLEPTKVDPQTVHVGSLEPTRAKTISDIMRDLKKYTAVQIIKQLKIDICIIPIEKSFQEKNSISIEHANKAIDSYFGEENEQ